MIDPDQDFDYGEPPAPFFYSLGHALLALVVASVLAYLVLSVWSALAPGVAPAISVGALVSLTVYRYMRCW